MGFGSRPDHKGRLDANAERPERPAVEFRQVIAGHVFDDLPATLNQRAIRAHDFDADQKIADRALGESGRAVEIGGNDSADHRPIWTGWVERQPLAVFSKNGLELGHRQAGPDGDGHIGRLVGGNRAERRRTQRLLVSFRYAAQVQKRAVPHRADGAVVVIRLFQQAGDFVNRRGIDHRLGHLPVDDELGGWRTTCGLRHRLAFSPILSRAG